MRSRLVLPAALQFVALSACGNTVVSADATPADATPADRAEAAVTDGCALPPDASPFKMPGFACAPAADAGPAVQCPAERVCARSACGAGCEACESTLFCIADVLPDGGRPERCAQDNVCSPEACGPGCRAVG
jgi:hypothetical protein